MEVGAPVGVDFMSIRSPVRANVRQEPVPHKTATRSPLSNRGYERSEYPPVAITLVTTTLMGPPPLIS